MNVKKKKPITKRRNVAAERARTLRKFDRLFGKLKASLLNTAALTDANLPVVPEGVPCPDYPHMHAGWPTPTPPTLPPMGTLESLALLRMLEILNITPKSLMEFYSPQVREALLAKGLPPIVNILPGVALALGEGEPPTVKPA